MTDLFSEAINKNQITTITDLCTLFMQNVITTCRIAKSYFDSIIQKSNSLEEKGNLGIIVSWLDKIIQEFVINGLL
jgi:hypothetical protein